MASLSWMFSLLLLVAVLRYSSAAEDDEPVAEPEKKDADAPGGRSVGRHYLTGSACTHVICLHGGTCVPTGSVHASALRYRCQCAGSYHGTHCEHGHRIVAAVRNPCYPDPCLNGGTCYQSTDARYDCVCTSYYSGTHCESPVSPQIKDPCNQGFNPCRNMCECVESCRHSSGYYCRSQNGYLGKNCTVPPPNVQCLTNQIIVSVDDAFVREYDLGIGNSRLYLAGNSNNNAAPVSQECFAVSSSGISHTFTIPLPFGKCGTNVMATMDSTVVNNIIWLNRFTNAAYDMPVPVIKFQCTYTREYVIVTSLQPALNQPATVSETGMTRVQGSIELCKVSSSCPNQCPQKFAVDEGAIYTVGEMIHLHIKADASMQGILYLKTLYLSCSSNPGSSVVQLVTNSCPGGSRNYMPTKVTHSGRSSSVCASFQVPRLQGCPAFYIHAELEPCGVARCAYNPSTCTQPLVGRRRRREVANLTDHRSTNVFGPIYILHGQRGVPFETLFPNNSIVSSSARIIEIDQTPGRASGGMLPITSADTSSVLLTAGLSMFCFLVVLGISSLVFYRSRFDKLNN